MATTPDAAGAKVPLVGVGCIVVRSDGHLLMVRNHRGLWSTPGGHLDFGESPAECAARETFEETGVRVASVEFVAVTNDVLPDVGRHYVTIWMRAEAAGIRPVIGDPDEIAAAEWFAPTDLPEPRHRYFENLLAGRSLPPNPTNLPFGRQQERRAPSPLATPGCPFCEIAAGTLPASLVAEDALTLAFLDLRQFHPGHVLVVPRQHVSDIRSVDDATSAALMVQVARIARGVDRVFPSDGLSIWHSAGAGAHQEVPHLHFHIHPRRLGDEVLRVYPSPPSHPARAVLDEWARQLRLALDAPRRTRPDT